MMETRGIRMFSSLKVPIRIVASVTFFCYFFTASRVQRVVFVGRICENRDEWQVDHFFATQNLLLKCQYKSLKVSQMQHYPDTC